MTLYFSAVQTQSGESGNTLDNQVQWNRRRESKHLCSASTSEAECSSRCSVSDIPPYAYTKQASAKTTEWSGSPRLLAHSTAKEKPRRYLRGNALGIVSPSGLRPRLNGNAAKARRRCRNALYKISLRKIIP